jgi:hypothetical protein
MMRRSLAGPAAGAKPLVRSSEVDRALLGYKEVEMTNESLHRIMAKMGSVLLLSVFIASSTPGSISAAAISAPTTPVLGHTPMSAIPTSVRLYGWVEDQMGNPIPSAIYVINNEWKPVGDIQTDDNGYYDLTVPGSERYSVMATPIGIPEHNIYMEGGYRVPRFFELTKAILPASDSVEVSFVVPPAAGLWIQAYSPEGDRLLMGDFNAQINPPGYFGYDDVYGVFPMDSFSLPFPIAPSIGKLRAAWYPEIPWSDLEPCFSVPPGEAVYLMMLWQVPGIGTIPLRADNRGQGYILNENQVLSIDLVYEFAETEYRRAAEMKSGYEAQGIQFSTEVVDWLSQASDNLDQARNQTDEESRALLSYDVLRLSIKVREQMALEVAEEGINARRHELTVVVQDEAGNPLPDATVTYNQTGLDFVLGYGQGHPAGPFPYPSFKAGQDIGYESLYGMVVWSKVSPQEGIYDFSAYDAAFKQWKGMGYEVNTGLVWLGSDNVPAWAQDLDFTEYKQEVAEFVKKAVEHFKGTVKFFNLVVEPTLQTRTGSRYVSVEFESNYLTGVQPGELIELIRTVFQAAREVDSDILLGYSAVTDYNHNTLNPLPFGAWPCSYSFLKSVLESGVQPDYIGVETYPGTSSVPLDLATVAAMLQAYHDLSGLPVMITESVSYPSRAEDYGETGPAPDVYWHEGLTQSVQAEWDTSVFRLAMGLPYVIGVQMFHSFPDNPPQAGGQPLGDCTGILSCVGYGTDTLTQDYEPKQVYYATRDLFDSWRAGGSAVTDIDGKMSFDGFDGTYAIDVTTADGLLQTFESHLGLGSTVVTVRLDRTKAITDLQHLMAEAQKAVDWSQNLGRTLDYNSLRSQLAEARSAMAVGHYGSARTIVKLILDTVTIRIDGNPDDWSGIQPIATLPSGGVAVNAPGIDLKALYGMRDDQFLYLMVEVYDPPITLQPGGIDSGGISYPRFVFYLNADTEEQYALGMYLPYTGQLDVTSRSSGKIHATLYSVAYGNVLELRVPLALLDNPSRVSVCAFVTAEENGEQKGAKAFECYVEVIHPVYSVYLPLVAGR